ncbi:MAG: SDR family NAD(P)-dependent oxidoreductase [Mariniphaga sp.]|nr:SDR family NAD(P)-dependent oxidoreductase [Mariniphaga sp.]MDD4426525.1 SDR family NAD(P)-dependent oxidoreductase [Mariniphaga sp.]
MDTALITGGSKRVGKAIAEHLAGKGWNLVIHYNTSEEPAERLVKQLQTHYPGQKFTCLQTDLINQNEVERLIRNAIANMGSIQLLVNNASIFKPGNLRKTSTGLFDDHILVNFKAPFILMRDFATFCTNGNIINLLDTRITSNKTNFAAYSLSKKSLWHLTQMAALEFAPNIRVNAIAPGVTLPPVDKDESYLWELAEKIPMKEPTGTDPILKSIDFILENTHLTGQLLFADGGENLGQNR